MVDEFVDFLLSRAGKNRPYFLDAPLSGYQEKSPAKPIIMADEPISAVSVISFRITRTFAISRRPEKEEVHEEPVRVRVQKVPTNKLLD